MDRQDFMGLYESYMGVYEQDEYFEEDVEEIDEANRAEREFKLSEPEKLAARNTSSAYYRFSPKDPSSPGRIRAKGALHAADQEERQKRHKEKRGVKESYDLYDLVLEYLLDEGLCESVENAEIMMAHMSEEWVDAIVESYALDEANRGDEYSTRSMFPDDARTAKQNRRNRDLDSRTTHGGIGGFTEPQKQELRSLPLPGEVQRQTTLARRRYTYNTRGIRKRRGRRPQ